VIVGNPLIGIHRDQPPRLEHGKSTPRGETILQAAIDGTQSLVLPTATGVCDRPPQPHPNRDGHLLAVAVLVLVVMQQEQCDR
jgi:hypothetical protein